MVFIFGIDIPLVELIFVLTLILILLLALLIYLVVSQTRLNKRLKEILRKENLELKDLSNIEEKEKAEIGLLRRILNIMAPRRIIKKRPKRRKPKKRKKPKKRIRKVKRSRFIQP